MTDPGRMPRTFDEQEGTEETAFRILEEEGIHGVLAFLNRRVEHRFTGLYRSDPPTLRNMMIYDRENPDLRIGADTPLGETFCSIVVKTEEPFLTGDASEDERVKGHPAGKSVRAYTGVLLRDSEGESFGTLCHFDHVPRPPATDDVALFERLASALRAALDVREP